MKRRSGIALLEVLIALTVIAVAGLTAVRNVRVAFDASRRHMNEERRVADADRVLTALTLLNASELTRVVGRRVVGAFAVDVQSPEKWLYRIAVLDPASDAQLLVTVVFKAE